MKRQLVFVLQTFQNTGMQTQVEVLSLNFRQGLNKPAGHGLQLGIPLQGLCGGTQSRGDILPQPAKLRNGSRFRPQPRQRAFDPSRPFATAVVIGCLLQGSEYLFKAIFQCDLIISGRGQTKFLLEALGFRPMTGMLLDKFPGFFIFVRLGL